MIVAELGNSAKINAVIGKGGGGYPLYKGEYEVTPTFQEQTLATADKVLKEDVTVKAIPRYDVANTAGGVTVYIATKEVQTNAE